jgi:hypothetical protein
VAKHITTGQNLCGLSLAMRSAKRLTFATFDFGPDCTPDGKSLLFVAFKGSSTWRIADYAANAASAQEMKLAFRDHLTKMA